MRNILFTGRWVYNESGLYKRKGLYVEVYNYDIRNDFEYLLLTYTTARIGFLYCYFRSSFV